MSQTSSTATTRLLQQSNELFVEQVNRSRRSFFLILIFDLLFVALMWLIYCTTKGYSLKEAFTNEIQNYDIEVSLFDVVVVSVIRFIFLNLFYICLRMMHWFPIATITFSSSSFLIAKVIIFAIKGTHKIITDYILLIISFLISWFQTWYYDVKLASNLKKDLNVSNIIQSVEDPLVTTSRPPTSLMRKYGSIYNRSEIGSFYSPMDSPNESDEETGGTHSRRVLSVDRANFSVNASNFYADDAKAQKYEIQADEMIKELLNIYNTTTGWKQEKKIAIDNSNANSSRSSREVSSSPKSSSNQSSSTEDDQYYTVISSRSFDKVGKVMKLESYLEFGIDVILSVLKDNVEDYPNWNATTKTAKILQRISENVSIIYVITHEQASGLITARDFINLSAYKRINDMHILGGRACEHEDMPVKEPYIRAENGPTGYLITPINENFVKITWLLNVHLKGWIPGYLVDQSLSNVQVDFISSLKSHLRKLSEGKKATPNQQNQSS